MMDDIVINATGSSATTLVPDSYSIYVTNEDNGSVHRYAPDGTFQGIFVSNHAGGLGGPWVSLSDTQDPCRTTAPRLKQGEYVCETIKMLKKYDGRRYKAVCLDAASFVDAPSSTRDIRVKGGKDTVQINFSKKSTKIIGALGQGTLDMQFHQKTDADSVIALLEYLRYRYGKVFVILDNAATHTGRQMDEYIKSTKGDVVLWFLPPRTPQHNPVEIQWREIRRAVADVFFEGLDELQKRIRLLLQSGEMAIVKLFGYMQETLKNQNGPWHPPRIIPAGPATVQQ